VVARLLCTNINSSARVCILFSLIGQEEHRRVEEKVGQGEEKRQKEEEDGLNRRLMMDAGILPATAAIRSAGQTRDRGDEKKRRPEKKIQNEPDQMNKLRTRVPNHVKTDKHSATGAASDKMSATGTACADKKRANICGKVSDAKGDADLERKLKTRSVALLLNINNAY